MNEYKQLALLLINKQLLYPYYLNKIIGKIEVIKEVLNLTMNGAKTNARSTS